MLGSTEQTRSRRVRKFAGIGIAEPWRLRKVEDENRQIAKMAVLTRDKSLLETLRTNWRASRTRLADCIHRLIGTSRD